MLSTVLASPHMALTTLEDVYPVSIAAHLTCDAAPTCVVDTPEPARMTALVILS